MAQFEELGIDELRSIIAGEAAIVSTQPPISIDNTARARVDGRVSWVFTSRRWLRESGRKISMWVNPKSIQVEMPKRATIEKTGGGAVVHQMKIRGREDVFDEFAFNFECETGNTMPIEIRSTDFGGRDFKAGDVISPGLVNLYDMHELQAQSHIIEETGEPNFIYAVLTSVAYPSLTLVGWFDPQAYGFQESAEDPYNVTYSLKMEVLATDPKVQSSADMLRAFRTVTDSLPRIPIEARR